MTVLCANSPDNSTGIFRENNFRDLIIAAGPRFRPGDKLKAFFRIVAERTGFSLRTIEAAWLGEPIADKAICKLQEAARHGIRDEAIDLAFQLEILAQRLRAQDEPDYQPHAAACDETARILRRVARGAVGNE